MAYPNTKISVHKHFFEVLAMQVKDCIGLITQKDSLNDGDIQAIKILIGLYEDLSNPIRGSYSQILANYSSACQKVQTRK